MPWHLEPLRLLKVKKASSDAEPMVLGLSFLKIVFSREVAVSRTQGGQKDGFTEILQKLTEKLNFSTPKECFYEFLF